MTIMTTLFYYLYAPKNKIDKIFPIVKKADSGRHVVILVYSKYY